MPRDAVTDLACLEAAGRCAVDDRGRLLWTSLDHAMTYAEVLALVRKSRQAVVTVKHPTGLVMFHVRKARPRVEEPCS